MKKALLVILIAMGCIIVITPPYSFAGTRERKTDRKIDHRTDRESGLKEERRDSAREPLSPSRERKTDRKIDRKTEREGERKEERRDDLRGTDRRQVNATEETTGEGKELYKENSQERRGLYQENEAQRHNLYDENSTQRKELKTTLDTGGDGKLSKDEVKQGKDIINELYQENSTERHDLYQENKEERQTLYQENSQQRRDLLKTFDLDGDGKISQDEMTEANAVLDSLEE